MNTVTTIDEIAPPARIDYVVLRIGDHDLRLRVVENRLEIESDVDVRIHTQNSIEFAGDRGVVFTSGSTSLGIQQQGVTLSSCRLAADVTETEYQGKHLKFHCDLIRITCRKLEHVAGRVFQNIKDLYQRVDFLHVKAGRIRSETEGNHLVRANTVRLHAAEDVRVHGKSINLG